jgi:hypothetical protein
MAGAYASKARNVFLPEIMEAIRSLINLNPEKGETE